MSRRKPFMAWSAGLLAALLLVVWGMAGCSGPSSATSVQVTLRDTSIESSLSTFTMGVLYHFVVTNASTTAHEFMIAPPPTAATEQNMRSVALAYIPPFAPGTTQVVDYTFTQPATGGSLEFACHLGGHYQLGMKLPITVTQAAAAHEPGSRARGGAALVVW
jgi:hypothetical protein